jgi:aminopeptidase N
MKRKMCRAVFFVLALTIPAPGYEISVEEQTLQECGQFLRAGDSKNDPYVDPQYAPDRKVDILHVAIDITPDFKMRTIKGTTTIRFAPIARELKELSLDAIDLDVARVTASAPLSDYSVTDKKITLLFRPPLPPGQETTVTVTYRAQPQQGLYFRTPELGYDEGDMHLFSQGETHGAPYWYPNYDYPNERSTSEVTCRVPPDMTVLSNGRLIGETVDPNTGLKAVTWLQNKPHVNYLIALAAGRFKKIEAQDSKVPLAFYVPASSIDLAANSFDGTADMLAFYEKEIGVPYPWDKYDQVVVRDFVAGGMENTTLTILTDNTLFTPATENIHSSQTLVAHEFVHQWFGDYVTCKDWSHLWLNEGFATYYEDLYDGHKNGRDSMLYGLYRSAQWLVRDRPDEKPIVCRQYRDADEQFDYRAYSKGGWVLHMLRTELGADLFRRCIKTYLERNACGCAVTEDLVSVVEELSGRSFDRFFDQWVYHAGVPKLTVSYEWLGADRLARISVKQTQDVGEKVMLFHCRTKVRFTVAGRPVDKEVVIREKEHDFYFPLEKEPAIVRFDPEYGLLAKVTFEKPMAMLYAQLADQNDVVGRLLALAALKGKKDHKTLAGLKTALNQDAFWGVRSEASQALRDIHTDEAFDALAGSWEQSDARVRLQVVQDLAGFYRPACLDLTKKILEKEKNPEIIAAAVENLGRYHSEETDALVGRYLTAESFQKRLTIAAIEAMQMLDEPNFIQPLQDVLSQGPHDWPARRFSSALNALAHLAREQEDRTNVREFLAGYVNHPNRNIQTGALRALGTLGDPKAIPIVRTFLNGEPEDRTERAAKDALDRLQEKKKLAPDEIIELRRVVEELKKEQQKTKDELEKIKKRLDAGTPDKTDGGNPPAETGRDSGARKAGIL